MNEFRHQRFAHALLAVNQHGSSGGRHALDLLSNLAHGI